ncbi:hypothetical protein ERJ75_001772000 [Trypanosoma vivax]|nr:hypothetical protein ERJ75_001772000 [Trypanosoma vivax]
MQRVCLRRMAREVDNKGQSTQKSGAANKGPTCQHRDRTKVTMKRRQAHARKAAEASGRIQARKAEQPKQQRCCTASARDDAGTCARGRVTGQEWAVGKEHERNADAQAQGDPSMGPGRRKRRAGHRRLKHATFTRMDGWERRKERISRGQMARHKWRTQHGNARPKAKAAKGTKGQTQETATAHATRTAQGRHQQHKGKANDAADQARKVDQDTNETREGSAGAKLSAARATRGNRHQARKSNAAARKKCAREANADNKRTQAAHRTRRHKTRGSVGRRPWRQAWDGRKDSHKKNKAAEPQHQTKWHDETQCAPRVGNKKQKSKTQREEKPGIADAR